jgi:Recombinase
MGPIDQEYMRRKTEAGWRLVALEWEREIEGTDEAESLIQDLPYGLRVAADCLHLEEDPAEKSALVMMMDLIVRDDPFSKVADELNQHGLRMRNGSPWNPVSVFNMLPRLIEMGPRIFSSQEWQTRKERLTRRW